MPKWLKGLVGLLHLSEDLDFLATILDWVGLRPRDIAIAVASGLGATIWRAFEGASILDEILYGLAALAIILAVIALSRHLMNERPAAPKLPTTPIPAPAEKVVHTPDISAASVFLEILANSEWSKEQKPDTNQPVSNWLALRLDREIHNRLRQGKLKAWGCRCLTTIVEAPESEIPAEEWANIEIDFNPVPRTAAIWRVRKAGFNVVYAGVRVSKDQFYGDFPLIAADDTPTPAGIEPDWSIQKLFHHIKPDLLENADEAAWDKIGNDLRDAFGLNLIRVWGRPLGDGIEKLLGERPVLRLIDPSYWQSGHFTYAFFDDTSGDAAHTYTEPNSNLPDYTDLRVNRAEAIATWRR